MTLQSLITSVLQLLDEIRGTYADWESRVVAKEQQVDAMIDNAPAFMTRNSTVDFANGLDTNDGSSANPYKTLSKAFAVIPVGGRGSVKIVGVYDLSIAGNVETGVNKNIIVTIGNDAQIKTKARQYNATNHSSHGVFNCINIQGGTELSLHISNSASDTKPIKLLQESTAGLTIGNIVPLNQGMFVADTIGHGGDASLNIVGLTTKSPSTVLAEVQSGKLFSFSRWDTRFFKRIHFFIGGHSFCKVIKHDVARLVDFATGTGSYAFHQNAYIVNQAGVGVGTNAPNIVTGLVKNAAGECLNINSNIDL